MAQKATSNKNGAKKAAAAKPVRKAVRAHASTTKAAKPKSPPPKAPPKGRVKAKAIDYGQRCTEGSGQAADQGSGRDEGTRASG